MLDTPILEQDAIAAGGLLKFSPQEIADGITLGKIRPGNILPKVERALNDMNNYQLSADYWDHPILGERPGTNPQKQNEDQKIEIFKETYSFVPLEIFDIEIEE